MIATQIVRDIHLPAWDTHFRGQIEKGPLFLGKGTYQFSKLERALAFAKRRGHAVDIGAHVGLWTRVLAAEFTHVTAFEPMPDCADCFEMNVKDLRNITLRRHALGSNVEVKANGGKVRLSNIATDIASAKVDPHGSVEADILTIDSCGLVGVDFVKVDVEGFEANIIRGGYRTIRRDQPVIIVEQKSRVEIFETSSTAAVDLLQSWGADIVAAIKGDYLMAWPAA